ncbi:HD domain-containing protein [Streptomyces poonensis]|uniref:Caspase domain-containing protein n=1 Tax=Streptomyces poonensis TaxID=68255 RepID=A0A918Q681_9ACTN|nr:caspase family protein [Streptomyces poonensis]GGZ34284.1 hypothetical protein GCM10010365_64000 [Streptomyces poonensis]GLJ89282.1 hypothetical protein GCM10017589_18820 [Streptomyces poonensis]
MGESRRALIVAVPQYELSDHFEDLSDTVGHDVELMTASLRSSGYSVELIGAEPGDPAGRSRILSAVSRVCATAPEDGTVLVHFTGHGLSVDGADHLVPADAQLTWETTPPRVAVDSLIGLDLSRMLRGCQAGTVLLTVDACRDALGGESSGGRATVFPAGRDRVAVLFGCGPGQTCGADEESGSHFSRALAEALHADTSPRTVAEVIAHTVRRTAEFARAARQKQTPTAHYAPSGHEAMGEVVLCTGRTLQEEWTTAVRDPELWAAVACDDERRAELQQALVRLTGECAKWRRTGHAAVPDPWADDDYPVRVLSRGLRPLLAPSQTQGGPVLDAGELTALAAAPFVREAVYAMGLKGVAAADPFRLEPATGDLARDPERADLEHTFAAHALLRRKGRELAGRKRTEDAGAVAAWLVHRHVSGKEELWDKYAPQLLAPLAKAMIGADAPSARIGELTDELVRVCRQTALIPARPYEGEREPAEARWRLDELVCPDGTPECWRPRELSWLIGVAGLLGGDPRQLPGVLVDNIGITDGLSPDRAVAAVRQLRWARDRLDKGLDLDLACPHPAVHAGLEALTDWADEAVQNIRRHAGPSGPTGLLAHLPDRVTCGRLRPQYDVATKGDAYGVPLMRFGLAEDETRELLMGTRLYGNRALALRELYQNALDACRYRQARYRYGQVAHGVPYAWKGDIVFRRGTDEDGRPYVECEDNGVGMGHETLRGTFARAGRRFEQSREYRREQARWRRADPDLRIFPNSRFGIGVFSYFMLADEISIWTRATDEYGRPEANGGLRVDIASSGSLFRIRRSEEAQPGGGTRVRLYLQADDVDVAGELGKHVWRTDFGMRVERDGEVVRTWEEEALHYFGDHTRPVAAGADIWFVEGLGCLLVDGVLVDADGMSEEEHGSARDWLGAAGRSFRRASGRDRRDWHAMGGHPFGCVVDLRGVHAPDISTNRNSLLSYDGSWADDRIREACKRFDAPQWLTLEWLWAFAELHPDGAVEVTRRLLAVQAGITSRLGWNRTNTVDFPSVGCFPADAGMVALRHESQTSYSGHLSMVPAVAAWRAQVLRSVGVPLARNVRALPLPATVEGYADLQAWEARIRPPFSDFWSSLQRSALMPLPGEALSLGDVLRRLRRYAVMGLKLPVLADLNAAHRLLLDSTDRSLLAGREVFDGLLFPKTDGTWGVLDTLRMISAETRVPLREALVRARRLAAAGFPVTVPDTTGEPPEGMVASWRELRVLSWHPSFAPPGERAGHDRPTRGEYEKVLARYGWLGLSSSEGAPILTDEPEQETSEDGGRGPDWTKKRSDEFERCFGTGGHAHGTDLSLHQLARASGMLSLSVADTVECYADAFARYRLGLPDYAKLADRIFTRLDSDLLGAALDRWFDLGMEGAAVWPVPLLDTATAVYKVQASTEEVVESLRGLAGPGLVDPEAPALVEHWRTLTPGDWKLLPGDDSVLRGGYFLASVHFARAALSDGIDLIYVLCVAAYAGMPIGAALARLRELGPLVRLDVSSPELPPSAAVADRRPEPQDFQACCGVSGTRPRWTPPNPADLVTHALAGNRTLGESIAILSQYAPLGALWTEPEDEDDPGHGAWREHRPTPHDRALFEPDLVGGLRAGPLELLHVAARFGWPVDQAWDRLAPYRPFGLKLLVERPGFEAVPTWQDLILLTEHYTGGAPALSGRVTPERIAVTARELEQPTRWVHHRLSLYAPLFGLELPDDYPAEPAATPTPEPFRAPAEPTE